MPEPLQNYYQVAKIVPIPKTFNVKSYHKSEKIRSQVVYKKLDNCDKINYSIKGKKTFVLQEILTYFRQIKNELVKKNIWNVKFLV